MSLASVPGSNSPLELAYMLRDARAFFHERFQRHGKVWKTRFVYPVVFVIGEEANKSVLVTRRAELSFGRGYAQTAVDKIFEGSIMLEDGDAHRTTRDILTPAVGVLAVRDSEEAVRRIYASNAIGLRDAPRDAYEVAQRATFDVAANVLTGLDLGEETERFRPLFERLIEGIMAPVKTRIPFGKLDRALTARASLFELMRPRVLAARDRDPVGLVGHLAHHRLPDGSHLDVDAVVGHLLLLFWAAYDTTASSLAWVIHVLAERPDWQSRIRDELSQGGDFTNGSGMPNLSAFLFEIERMYPSALFFPRIAVQEFELHGFVIPAGTPTFYSPYLSHRDPDAFDNPNAFDPERWLESRGERRAKQAKLVGFGGGPRVCLGKSFAKLQLRIAVHEMLSRFQLEPDPRSRPSVMALPVHHPVESTVRFTSLG